MVVVAAADGRLSVLRSRILRWFGTISYGLYLWHYLFLRVQPHGVESTGGRRAVLVVLAIAVAAGSWYLLERPVLRAVARRRTNSMARGSDEAPAR